MKRFLSIFGITLALLFSVVSCKDYDTDINNLEKRVATLESTCATMNSDLASLQSLVQTLSSGSYITSVSQTSNGYTITLSDGKTLTISNGKDGKDGADGKDGVDGVDGETPEIGVAELDGVYYWTINGEWLLDANGNKVPVTGADGKDGVDGKDGADGVTPELKIEDGYWYVSVDGGNTWTQLGAASSEGGESSTGIFSAVDLSNPLYVTFTLTDGSTFSVPRYGAMKIGVDSTNTTIILPAKVDTTIEVVLPANLTEAEYEGLSVEVISPEGTAAAVVTKSIEGLDVTLTPPGFSAGVLNKNAALNIVTSGFSGTAMIRATLALSDGSAKTAARAISVLGTDTIGSIIAAADETEVTASKCDVVALTTRGFVISDGTDVIYVYVGSTPSVSIGDIVTVSGTKTTYNGVPEISNPEVEIISYKSVVTYPEPNDITASFDEYTNSVAEYISFTGDLAISGNYYNITVDGATVYTGSVTYPIEEIGLADLNNHNVTITGYYNGVSGSKYLNIIAVEVVDNGEVKPESTTIEEIIALTDGTACATEGALVVALTTRGFVIADDNNNAIYVYTSDTPEVEIGDLVNVSGTKTTYNGVPEITSPDVEIKDTDYVVKYPTANDITASFDEYTNSVSEFISITGTLNVSGTRYNIIVDGAETNKGSVNLPVEDITNVLDGLAGHIVTVKGYYNGTTSSNYLYIVAVEVVDEGEPPVETMTLAEIAASDDKTEFQTGEVLVTALTTRGFVVSDGTTVIYAYTKTTPEVKIGDKVTFAGTKTTYANLPELTSITDLKVVSSGNTVTYPTANDITSTFNSYSSSEYEYISFTGDLVKSGNYYNVTVNGANYIGSVASPIDELGMADLSGHNITVTGYFSGFTGSNKYLNIIAVEVKDNGATSTGGDDDDDEEEEVEGIVFDATSDMSSSSAAGAYSLTKDDVTIAVSNGMFGQGQHYRIYKGQTFTVSSSSKKIESITMECTATGTNKWGPGNFTLTSGGGSYTYETDGSTGTWTGSSTNVVLTAESAQVRMTKVIVKLAE